ncbi:AAA family ATPase [Paenibacillus sp. MMS20-IR301]|uniref:AAA family ATPase n=1 Tax=Paenibacillus sp. MMS20-IR301 TaxID=2895946 RepID=UPI0028F08BB6|nr:AAA family ATPase [Paenibacillus sp. MMS20-IR301]WNS44635.1 AAA family ATPase [Paenibacillus sp. MMS20-IR301]
MTKLVIVNGTMGVGKSAVCKQLLQSLDHSVWLDGDWCWMMQPWTVNEENIIMVENNINFMLRSFLTNSSFKYVIFSWVLHRKEIIDRLLSRLADLEYEHQLVTLICSAEALRQRMHSDNRTEEQILRSLDRIRNYEATGISSINTSDIGVNEVAARIIQLVSDDNAYIT